MELTFSENEYTLNEEYIDAAHKVYSFPSGFFEMININNCSKTVSPADVKIDIIMIDITIRRGMTIQKTKEELLKFTETSFSNPILGFRKLNKMKEYI